MTAAVSVPADEIIGHRYATRAKGGERIGHLLTRTWLEEPLRRGRPALCGVRAQKWRAVHLFDDPHAFEDCPACSAAAGLITTPAPTVRIAPTAPQRRHDPVAHTPAPPATSQAERTARRAAFRDSFRHARP